MPSLSAVAVPKFEMVADFAIQVRGIVFQDAVDLQAVINATSVVTGVAGWLRVNPMLAVVAAVRPDARLL